ncbi:MAG: UDP-glucose 4-epimerase family protein [Ferrovibrio sp.]|uniref:UDP-glucose 4-epimerase family protein n=1 Tax=Ferrovibrio sp. TaxID=1917215 RepID=UPI003919AB70
MNILVTGASGFIGKHLCQTLDNHGKAVKRAARRSPTDDNVTDDTVIVGDIGPETDWGRALAVRPEVVVHLAARVHVMNEIVADPLAAFRAVNVAGTLNLARQAAAAGARRFVFLSSIKVNGETNAPDRPFKPDDIPAPQDAYAISKLEAESGLFELAKTTGMEVVIIRPPLVYGPGVKGNFALLLKCVRWFLPLPLGAVRNLRSLIALENLTDFIALCADREKSPAAANQIFLISDSEPVSTAELLRRMAKAYGRPAILIPVPTEILSLTARMIGRTAAMDRLLGSLVVDSSRALHVLGWRPVVTMEHQLKIMAAHDATRS